jgi:hypothetical protein
MTVPCPRMSSVVHTLVQRSESPRHDERGRGAGWLRRQEQHHPVDRSTHSIGISRRTPTGVGLSATNTIKEAAFGEPTVAGNFIFPSLRGGASGEC